MERPVTSVTLRTCGFNMFQQFESWRPIRSTGARHAIGNKTIREVGDCVVCECWKMCRACRAKLLAGIIFGWFWLTNFSKFYSFWLRLFRTIGFAYITHVHELLAQFNPMISQNRTKWVGRALIQLPSGNQTWLAGQSPMIFPRLAASPFSSGFRSQPRLITGCSASWKPLDLIENGRIWLLIHQQLHLTPARRC